MQIKELDNSAQDPTVAKVVYILYLVGLVVGLTTLVGVVMAYIYRSEASGWLREHYTYQIRTFWIGMLYSFVSFVLTIVLIGWLLMIVVVVWYVIRCVKGLNGLGRQRPPENVETWLI